ncbi:MAG: hypothetical protein WD556_03525 [Actinomycetota bacterium]
MESKAPRARLEAALLVTLVALSVLVGLFLPMPARAGDCPGDYQIQGAPSENGRGVRVGGDHPGMFVGNAGIGCARASSIGVVNSSGTRFVELGWYEEEQNVTPCPGSFGPPRILVAKYVNGTFTCDLQNSITDTPRNDDFKVSDPDQDGDWNYYRNSDGLGFYGLGSFTSGQPVVNGERKSDHADPTMYANFRGLDRMGASQDWSEWSGTHTYGDSDPDFSGCLRSPIHIEMPEQCS